jgi:Zn-finger nucleic acid-binding protein
MKCPVCGNPLTEVQTGSIKVQACKDGCGGLWVSHFQLDKIDKPDEYDGEILANLQKKTALSTDLSQQLHCPQCLDHVPMMRHFFSVKREVLINECPECGGYWLNMGELLRIRQTWKTDAEREKAADDYFAALFGKEMAEDKAKDEVWETKADKVYDIFKYLCPSHYFMGKKWNRPF